MKISFNNIVTLCSLLSLLIISSCSVKRVIVTGTPGTTIHKNNYNYEQIGTIGLDGKAKVKLDADEGFYLSKAPNNHDAYVPFATNVKDNYNANDNSLGEWFASFLLSTYSAGLLAPIFYQPDKPFNTVTNHDLIVFKTSHNTNSNAHNNNSVNAQFYKVSAGDTLQSIADAHGVSIEQICTFNKISSTDQLQVGRLIKIR